MERKYPLGSLTFERKSELAERTAFARENTGWVSVLGGAALKRFKSRWTPKLPAAALRGNTARKVDPNGGR